MKICVIGTGYVGLVSGTCFSDLGNDVICVDNDKEKVENLEKGIVPIYETGLKELIERNVSEGRLSFTVDLESAVRNSEIIFIAVGTPSMENGEADLSSIYSVAEEIARIINGYKIVVIKSTVPVGTTEEVERTIEEKKSPDAKFDIISNPEFLREGTAVFDTLNPDRIVIGAKNSKAVDVLIDLHKPLEAPIMVTDIRSAEMIKYASNAYLATKISFVNAIANICENVGANIVSVAEGIGLDKRIGPHFLHAGSGWGGSCLPKDTRALIHIANKCGYDFKLLKEVINVNEYQKQQIVEKTKEEIGELKEKTICILGLSFKPNTDDMREAPSVDIINKLKSEGAKVCVFDPIAMKEAKKYISDITFCRNAYEAAQGSDALIIVTDWNEFKELNLTRVKELMNHPVIIDGRNIYNPEKIKSLGFRYTGVGR